jgi:hypothetical protein
MNGASDMDSIDTRNREDDLGEKRRPEAVRYEAEIGDEDFRFVSVAFDDRKMVGAQIAAAVGKHPVENYVVLQDLASGEIETLRSTEIVDLGIKGIERFFVIEGSVTFRFTVEGLSMEWPRPVLRAGQIKLLARADKDDLLVLVRDGVDRVFEDDDEVHLDTNGVEHFKLRKPPRTVTVYYKETPFELERRVYTAEELIGIFRVPAGYKLDLIEHDGKFRELKPGERIKVREGLEFSSHPPHGQSS